MDCGICGRPVCSCYEDSNGAPAEKSDSVALEASLLSENPGKQTRGTRPPCQWEYPLPFTGSAKRPCLPTTN